MDTNLLPSPRQYGNISIEDRQSPLSRLVSLILSGSPELNASGLKGAAAAYVAACVFRKIGKKHIVVVTPTQGEAQKVYDEIGFFLPFSEVLYFPPVETKPYSNVLSHTDISSQRIWTLYRICDSDRPVIVVGSVKAFLQKVIPCDVLIDHCFRVTAGQEIDRDALCKGLVESGYTSVSLVQERGDLSIRGEVIDLFPPGMQYPVRLDFFGDTVETIKLFDPASQRSVSDVKEAEFVPVRDVILSSTVIDRFFKQVEASGIRDRFASSRGKAFFESIINGFMPSGVEYCSSFIYGELCSLFEFFGDSPLMILKNRNELVKKTEEFSKEIEEGFARAIEEKRVASPPGSLFLETLPETFQRLYIEEKNTNVAGADVEIATDSNESLRSVEADTRAGVFDMFTEKLQQWLDRGYYVHIVCHTKRQCERLHGLLADYSVEADLLDDTFMFDIDPAHREPVIHISAGDISRGFQYEHGMFILVSEEEIFGEKRRRAVSAGFKTGIEISDFSELAAGDQVVHRDNGIGIFCGLVNLQAGGTRGDFVLIEYAGADKLYLPVDKINLIHKYEGVDGGTVKLDRLGGSSWERTKKRVRESAKKIARDLVELYSRRMIFKGHAFSPPDHYYREFEAAFEYDETPDQLAAIEDVMTDMSGYTPMDRLICGDVGYGKTEVALRACFRAVMDGRQAAVLVPTTVLAQQHFETFSRRFERYPVRVDVISRFKTPRQQKEILAGLAEGKIDIVVGTHRLVQKDVMFKNLGLLVVDEEHRFGVTHKEQIKKLRASVDVLTLTATPIPRTLQFSMIGLRDFSVIETPPEDRLSIRTMITNFDDTVIKEAIMRELKRGGQIFFVHDRVRSIHAMAQFLRQLVPGIRIGIAHGQMKEHELEKSMIAFVKKDIDMLLCTTIIESGLDFPSANTIIINNAHRLGLAQMYQLRGRVGRGKVRAYAYMLIPGRSLLNRDAAKRLEALSEFTELGSGYRLATRDMQIRGAGNLLGHSQSGHIVAVGIDMYLDLLNTAIAELKGEQQTLKIEPEINLNVTGVIPESYVSDVNQRLVLYRRIATAPSDETVDEIEEELRDRFGKVPQETLTLLSVAKIKNLLRERYVLSVDMNGRQLIFTFHEKAEPSVEKVLSLVSEDPKKYFFTPEFKLYAEIDPKNDIISQIRQIMT